MMSEASGISWHMESLSQAEVDDFYGRDGTLRRSDGPAVRAYHLFHIDEHQICRLQIAVDHAAFFCCDQRGCHFLCDANRSANIQRSRASHAFLERLALDQFHRVKELARLLVNAELEHGGDVFVSQRRSRARFAQKTFARGVARLGAGEPDEFQCDLALERGVDGAIGGAHRAVPKFVKTSVLMSIDLVNPKMLVTLKGGLIFRGVAFAADPNSKQTDH